MNSLQQKIEQVLRDKILDIADEYKGVKREEHVQVYLGNPSQLVKELFQLFEEEMKKIPCCGHSCCCRIGKNNMRN